MIEGCNSRIAFFAREYAKNFSGTIRFLGSRYGIADQAAEEIAQEAWARGYRKLNQLRDQKNVTRWVFSIAKNMAMNIHRKQRRFEHVSIESAPSSLLTREQAQEGSIEVFFPLLSEREKNLIVLWYVEGFRTTEIVDLLPGTTPNSIRVALTRARRKIREHLQSFGRPR